MREPVYHNLADQIIGTKTALEQLPDELVGSRYYFHMTLRMGQAGAKDPLHRLLDRTGVALVGSRGDAVNSAVALMVSAPIEALDQLLYAALDEGHFPKGVVRGLSEVTRVAAPCGSDILGQRPYDGEQWDCVLHPSGPRFQGSPSPTDDATFDKWCAWVEHLGGEVAAQYRRPLSGLTYVPMRLPTEHVTEAVRFNPLRSVRPLARVGMRAASSNGEAP